MHPQKNFYSIFSPSSFKNGRHYKTALRVLFFVILQTLAACQVYTPRIKENPVKLPDSYLARPAGQAAEEKNQEVRDDRWWRIFQDKKLNELVDAALANNLDIKQAMARLAQYRAACLVAGSGRRPAISIAASGSHTHANSVFAPFSGGQNQSASGGFPGSASGFGIGDYFSLSADLAYELDFWHKLDLLDQASRSEFEAGAEDVRAAYLTLAGQITEQYYQAAELRGRIKILEGISGLRRQLVDLTRERYLAGLSSSADLLQAGSNLEQVLAAKADLESELKTAEHAIALLLGRFPQPGIAGSLAEIPDVPELPPCGIPADLLKHRPDIQAEFLRLTALDARVGAAVADRFPSVNLSASYSGASQRLADVLRPENIFWSIGTSIMAPVLDGGRRKAEVEKKKAQLEEQLAKYRQTVITAVNETEDALARFNYGNEKLLRINNQANDSARELRLTMERYFAGLDDYLTLLNTQISYQQSRSDLLSAKHALLSSRIRLALALGGSWMKLPAVSKTALR